MASTYLIGSLRNPYLGLIAEQLRKAGVEVFDDWYAAGPEADDAWRRYEQKRGRTYEEALNSYAAEHVFNFDHYHLVRCQSSILALPCGKSGHLEFGWMRGAGKPGWILLDRPDRWDVMYKFASGVYSKMDDLVAVVQTWAQGQERPVDMKPGKTIGVIDLTSLHDRTRYCFTCSKLIHPTRPQEHVGCA